jgi:hypothetical protein
LDRAATRRHGGSSWSLMNSCAASALWLVALVNSLGANAEGIHAGAEFRMNT